MAVFTPMSLPRLSSSGPPELPGEGQSPGLMPNPNPNPNPNPTLQARAHVLERFREDAHGNFYNPDELAAETEELFGKSFEQARHLPPL